MNIDDLRAVLQGLDLFSPGIGLGTPGGGEGGILDAFRRAAIGAALDSGGNQERKGSESDIFAKALDAAYGKSVSRMCKVINKLSLGKLNGDFPISTTYEYTPSPDPDVELKKFRIGDRIVVNVPFQDFKYIQKRVPGWKRAVKNLHGRHGIVTDMSSTDDVTVQVYFPELFSSCSLHRAVLAHDVEEQHGIERVDSRFKVGDLVQTCSLSRVVAQLMRKLPDLPDKYIGETGQVIAVTNAGIFVTYNGLLSYCIDASLLQKSPDQEYTIDIIPKDHIRKFRTGEKVKVIANLKILIENQKNHGGFNKEMCVMAGKEGYITDINDDDTVDVSTGFSRGWRMNHESIIKIEDNELDSTAGKEDLEFLPGDVVKVKIANDVRKCLSRESNPLIFLDYLANTAIIDSVDDDFDAWVRFNSSSKICIKTSRLVKASEIEKKKYEDIRKRLLDLKHGEDVCLDVGPPNFVRSMLAEHFALGVSQDIASVLTTKSQVVGWIDERHAVIRSSIGKLYKIHRKYLTLPERFELDQVPENKNLSWDAVAQLRQDVKECVEKIHEAENAEEPFDRIDVEIYSMIKESFPKIEFRIRSSLAESKIDLICDELSRIYGWGMEKQYPHVYKVKASRVAECVVIIGFLFNEDIHFSQHLSATLSSESAGIRKARSNKKVTGGSGQNPIPKPTIESVEEFQFLPLRDEALSRTVFFPYLVRGPAFEAKRPNEEFGRGELRGRNTDSNNFSNSRINNLFMYAERVSYKQDSFDDRLDG